MLFGSPIYLFLSVACAVLSLPGMRGRTRTSLLLVVAWLALWLVFVYVLKYEMEQILEILV
jgi:hypothetical protein